MPFDTLGLDARLLRAVKDLGFEEPTPIQNSAIPPLMEGRDLLAAAATGSGKTAAFLLPILHRILNDPKPGTRVLVLAPTRELAAQITEHLSVLAAHASVGGAAVYGGVGMQPQIDAFKGGVPVLAATPGRLLDHMQHAYARLKDLDVLVLDEADRMLDMGFLPDIRRILKQLPPGRQHILVSATLPEPIVQLSREFLRDPVVIGVERRSAPASGITHAAYPVPHELKSHLLLTLLQRAGHESILAFTRTKHRANRLADFLQKRGVACARIHGSRSQAQRTEALAGFKEGRYRVLVATDIAARGIDVEALGLVVNFDVPNLPEDYIHRVGRTARAELDGDAVTLVSPLEEEDLAGIERHLGRKLPRQRLEGFDYDHKPQEKFEVPLTERIATIRAQRAEERARAKAKAERKSQAQQVQTEGSPGRSAPSPAAADGAPVSPAAEAERRKRRRRRRHGKGGPHAHPTAAQSQSPSTARAPHAKGPDRPRKFHPKGPSLPPAESDDNRGNRIEPETRPRGGHPGLKRPGNRPPRTGKERGPKPVHGVPETPISPRSGGYSFIRSSRFVEPDPLRGQVDTSGVREDTYRSRKHDEGGRSHWARVLQEKTKQGWKPSDADPED